MEPAGHCVVETVKRLAGHNLKRYGSTNDLPSSVRFFRFKRGQKVNFELAIRLRTSTAITAINYFTIIFNVSNVVELNYANFCFCLSSSFISS